MQYLVQDSRNDVRMVDGPGRYAVQRQAQDTQGKQTVKGRRTELFLIPPPFPDIEKGNIGNDQQTTDLELAVFHAYPPTLCI